MLFEITVPSSLIWAMGSIYDTSTNPAELEHSEKFSGDPPQLIRALGVLRTYGPKSQEYCSVSGGNESPTEAELTVDLLGVQLFITSLSAGVSVCLVLRSRSKF